MQTDTEEKVTLANIEEWFCDLATVESNEKFAKAAQTIRMAREALAVSTDLPLNFDHDIIGELILSPDAIAKRDGPGTAPRKHRKPWGWRFNKLFR